MEAALSVLLNLLVRFEMLQAGVLTCDLPGSCSPGDRLAAHRPPDPHHPPAMGPQASRAMLPAPRLCVCASSMQARGARQPRDFVDVPQDSESQLQEQEKED